MDRQGLPDKIGQDVRDVLRRIEQQREMLARMIAAQVQSLGELRGLLRRGGGSGAGGVTPNEVDEETRATALAGACECRPTESGYRAVKKWGSLRIGPTGSTVAIAP